ncbi:hypothetical protein [Streptomyces tricolor]
MEFSHRELEGLRQIAKERGTPMKALMREAAAAGTARHRALREGAEAQATQRNEILAHLWAGAAA